MTFTALNGRLPAGMLTVADTGPNGPQRLRRDAAASWGRALAAGMPAGHLRSGYRTRAQQAEEVARAQRGETPSAAPVGRSYHGEGTAADADEPARRWLRRYGRRYGWAADTVAREPWHFLYLPALDQEADDMQLTDALNTTNPAKGTPSTVGEALAIAQNYAYRGWEEARAARVQVAALSAAVETLAAAVSNGDDVDAQTIRDAVRTAVTDALADVDADVTLTLRPV